MWNNLLTLGAREKGKSSKSSTSYSKDDEKSGGGEGGLKGKEPEASNSLDIRGSTSHPSQNEANVKDQKHKKCEKSSSKVVLENHTDKVLVLREKVRAANGIVRHQINAGESIAIHVGSHNTYYRLLVYAVEVKDSATEDTGLTIDSDRLCDATRIVISKDATGKKYIIS